MLNRVKLPKPGHTAGEIKSWIGTVLALTAWKPSRLAQEAGLAPSTLNRFLAGNAGGFLPSTKTIGRLEQVACERIRQRIADGEMTIEDFDRAVSGPNGMAVIQEMEGGGKVVAQWGFPEDWFRFTYGTEPEDCSIMAVLDDAMAPDLNVNDRVIVDRRFRDPMKDGAATYMIATPSGTSARAIAPMPDGRLMVSSRNKVYEAYACKPGRVHVLGRIAGMWRRMAVVLPALVPFI